MLTTQSSPPIPHSSQKSEAGAIFLLSYAKKQLLTEDIPLQLRAIAYLRLGCIATQKLSQIWQGTPQEVVNKSSFFNLLADLCYHNLAWWGQCWISDRGILRSHNPEIDKLLDPLNYFFESYAPLQDDLALSKPIDHDFLH